MPSQCCSGGQRKKCINRLLPAKTEERPAGNKQQGNGYPGKDGDVVERLAANNESQIKGKGLAHLPAPRQKRLYPVIEESLKQFFKLK